QRLWFMAQMDSAGRAYHIPAGLRLKGRLDRAALVAALDLIVVRHEALRTRFVQVDGEAQQVFTLPEQSRFALTEHDLRASADATSELARLVDDEASAPFDLARGPLIRGRLISLADDE